MGFLRSLTAGDRRSEAASAELARLAQNAVLLVLLALLL